MVRIRLFNAWVNTINTMQAINSKVKIYPIYPSENLIIVESEKSVKFSINKPVSFLLPEKTKVESQKRSTNWLVVAVSGWISFEKEPSTGKLTITNTGKYKTKDYRTYMEYYRIHKSHKNTLKFLCSVHYDFEKIKRNHPVFHAQLTSKSVLIEKTIYKSYEILEDESEILRTFRIPCTQHDVFGALTQLSADHLLSASDHSHNQLLAIKKEVDFFISAEFQTLNDEPNCVRSIRYYPD